MDKTAPMDLGERCRNADGETQEAFYLQGHPEQPVERLTARILEHQYGATPVARKLQRAQRPHTAQLILQAIFVREAIEAPGCWVLLGGEHGQHRFPVVIGALAPCPAKDAVAPLPQDLEVATSRSAETG